MNKRPIPYADPVSTIEAKQETPASPAAPRLMTLNMGPQHPSTHGVLRIVLELDGETIVKARPDIGFLHTGIEKQMETRTWQQAVTLTDRVDYLSNLSNNLAYALAVEKLLGLEIPPRAQWARVMKALGCRDAMNLDAGASLAMSYRGRTLIRPGRNLTNLLAVYVDSRPRDGAGPSDPAAMPGSNGE